MMMLNTVPVVNFRTIFHHQHLRAVRKKRRSTLLDRLQQIFPAVGIAPTKKPTFSMDLKKRIYDATSDDDIALGMHEDKNSDMHFNVLKFWDKITGWLPLHATLAFRVCSALPTEANCERVFSLAGRTITKLRHHLGPKTLAALVIVGSHLKSMAVSRRR